MKRTPVGFTLINLLITLGLSSILLTSGTPSLSGLLSQYQAETAYQRLMTSVQFTRIQSVNYHSQVILCPSSNQIDCESDWNQQLMIFVDKNHDETHNHNDILLRIINASDEATLFWRASGSRRYLRFKADGSTGNQNGRLSYCLQKGNKLYAKQIIMYRTGRPRKATPNVAKAACWHHLSP